MLKQYCTRTRSNQVNTFTECHMTPKIQNHHAWHNKHTQSNTTVNKFLELLKAN